MSTRERDPRFSQLDRLAWTSTDRRLDEFNDGYAARTSYRAKLVRYHTPNPILDPSPTQEEK